MKKLLSLLVLCISLSAFADPLGYPNKSTRITTNTTQTLKTGPGILSRLTVGIPGTATTITIYDNTTASGTIIAVVNTVQVASMYFDAEFTTGLTVVTAGTTPADLSVGYK